VQRQAGAKQVKEVDENRRRMKKRGREGKGERAGPVSLLRHTRQ
jgi:hypothetical protein